MEFCGVLRSVKFVVTAPKKSTEIEIAQESAQEIDRETAVRSLGRFLGRGVCLWLQRSQGSLTQDTHQRATPGNPKVPLPSSFHFQQPSIPFSHPHFHQN